MIAGVLLIFLLTGPVASADTSQPLCPVYRAQLSYNTSGTTTPFTIMFREASVGCPTQWNWSFGDGTFSEERNPVHVYTRRGKFLVELNASNNFSYETQYDYLDIDWLLTPFNASILSKDVPNEMVLGKKYHVHLMVKNMGSKPWYGDPANSDYVYLAGVGGATGDAAKFKLTTWDGEPAMQIPMRSHNDIVRYNSVDLFDFYLQAPDTVGTYEPSFRMNSKRGEFGEFLNFSVNVTAIPPPVAVPDETILPATFQQRGDPMKDFYSLFDTILARFLPHGR